MAATTSSTGKLSPKKPTTTANALALLSPISGPSLKNNSQTKPLDFAPLKPSEYIHDRLLSTGDKLAQVSTRPDIPRIIELSTDTEGAVKQYQVPIDRPLFQPTPSAIALQSFEPFVTYEVVINFRNIDKFTRRLKVMPIDSPYFSVAGWKSEALGSERVAPGMEVAFLLRFKPEERIDYAYDLVCVSERETFLVPIRATGGRALLDFPDTISFSEVPVRHTTSKTLLVRNIGNRDSKFRIETDGPFDVEPSEGFIKAAQSIQVDLQFHPKYTGSYENNFLVNYDTGEKTLSKILGTADDALIRLEKQSIKMDPTSVGLILCKTVRLLNRSDIMSKFRWKACSSDSDDAVVRSNRQIELYRDEAIEIDAYKRLSPEEKKNDPRDLTIIGEKYKNLRKKMESDPLHFADPNFRIEPSSGTVWPGSTLDVKIYFQPQKATEIVATAYCETDGRESRLPLHFKGDGVGPKARFSYDVLDLEEVFVNTSHSYEVVLENRGDIDVSFKLRESSSLFGPLFTFYPSSGLIKVNGEVKIAVTLAADHLGDVYEEFIWDLDDSPEPISLIFKGKIIGPQLSASVRELNFGNVAFGFASKTSFRLDNISQIPVNYIIRLEDESLCDPSDIRITKARGSIKELESCEITVEFLPSKVKLHELILSVDVERVARGLVRIPLRAFVCVPKIVMEEPNLAFGNCFLSFAYQKQIVLVNDTNFAASFEILPQDEALKPIYTISFKKSSGIIKTHSKEVIGLEFVVKRLGHFCYPVKVKVSGQEEGMTCNAEMAFHGVGPSVSFSSMEVNCGKIPVLVNHTETLRITNTAPIPAIFTALVAGESSVFSASPSSGRIPPSGAVDIRITAFLDDFLKFADILKIGVQSDKLHEIQLVARGQGTTIIFDDSLKSINFGDIFSNQECCKEFTLVNKGRRTHSLSWTRDDKRLKRGDTFSNTTMTTCFEVVPSRCSLKPNSQQIISVRGFSSKAVKCNEVLVCQAVVDKDPSRKLITECAISANFITPLIETTPSTLKFACAYVGKPDDFKMMNQSLMVKNCSALPLEVVFKCPPSYKIDISHSVYLVSGDSKSVTVSFDPTKNNSRTSAIEQSKLLISYTGHSQKDYVDLISEVSFPNVTIATKSIDFGCIAQFSEEVRTLKVKNSSSLAVHFSWCLDDSKEVLKPKSPGDSGLVNQAFDVVPSRGVIEPNEEIEISVIFYGVGVNRYKTTAVCEVTGGPKYSINLKGESSGVEYSLDRQSIGFGIQPYQNIVEQELVLVNKGRLPFNFDVNILLDSPLFHKLLVMPPSGTLVPHERQKLLLRYCNCVPESTLDYFYIQVASGEPIPIAVTGTGTYENLVLSLPREHDLAFNKFLQLEKSMSSNDSQGPEKTESDLEYQAEAKLLCEKIKAYLTKQTTGIDLGQLKSKNRYVGAPLLYLKGASLKDARITSMTESSKINLTSYVCDFGFVVRNTTRKKTIRISNRNPNGLPIWIDKSILVGTGFSIEPERIKNIPGRDYVDVIVTLQAKSPLGLKSKSIDVDVPLSIPGGPLMTMKMKAVVSIPEICISPSLVEFGDVFCGYRRTSSILLQNFSSVPSEWTTEDIQTKDKDKKPKKKSIWSEFSFSPAKGVIQPGEKCLVKFQFMPQEEKEYQEVFPINISMNSKPLNISAQGKGLKQVIAFDREQIQLGPILPSGEGFDAKVVISNPTNQPLEIYSLDFDRQYLEEEALLRLIDGYQDGAIFLPPRSVGGPLPETVVQQAQSRLMVDEVQANNEDSVSESNDKKERESIFGIVLHGPPMSGRTTQAKRLSALFGFAYVRLDDLIDSYKKVHKALCLDEDIKLGGADTREGREHKGYVTEDILAEIFRARFLKSDCSKGVVIEGIDSRYISHPLVAFKSLGQVDSLRKVFFVNLNLDLQAVREREINCQRLMIQRELDQMKVKELSEEDYDQLSIEKKDQYDKALARFKWKLRAIDEKKRLQRKPVDEDMTSKLGEKKEDEKGRPKKKGKQNLVVPAPEKPNPIPAKDKSSRISSAQAMHRPGTVSPKGGKKVSVPVSSIDDENVARQASENSESLPEAIIKQYEAYTSTIDDLLSFMKDRDADKQQHASQLPSLPAKPVNLPMKKLGKSDAKNSEIQLSFHSLPSEAPEHHFDEAHAFAVVEVNAALSEDTVFCTISDHLPKPPRKEELSLNGILIMPAVTEQLRYFPVEREPPMGSKHFTLFPSNWSPTPEDDPALESKVDTRKTKPLSKADEPKPSLDSDALVEQSKYRWVIAAGQKRELFVRFNSNDTGRFDQTLLFEITGQKQKFPLKLTGLCQHAVIIGDPKRIFSKTRRNREEKSAISGEFVLSSGTYEFGPLLYSKPRDRYLEKYPENHAQLNIINPSASEVKVNICLRYDTKGDVFFFEPSSMDLAPGQTQTLNVWAYPRSNNAFEDSIIICVKDNPEPYVFKLSCIGVRPEVEIDKKTLSFDKLLLGRVEKREIKLRNPTHMPIAWRLTGIDGLGDEFDLWPLEGVIESSQETILSAEFCGMKPLIVKKMIRLEISDTEKISGVVQDIPVLVTAEAYDIAMDIHFPKGYDGGLDFGVMKVFDEGKQLCTLKNKGKYEVGFRFLFDNLDLADLFTTSPQQGILQPSDKPFFVQFLFKSTRELQIKDIASCKCQIFEPSTDEVTATIPIKLCARAVFSKFAMMPVKELNFGSISHGSRISRQFVLENNGEFDYRYSVYKLVSESRLQPKSRPASQGNKRLMTPPTMKTGKKEILKQADSLNFGAFSVFPTSAVVAAGTKQVVNVEFHSEQTGYYEEFLAIDISDRSHVEFPDPLEYRLFGEICIPGINNMEFSSIFEEHAICKRLEVFAHQSNIYAEEDRVFYFGAYLVNQSVTVRFKLSNPFKIPADVTISTKQRSKLKSESADFAFDVEPKRVTIPSHEYRYVTVSFHPTAIQSYAGLFEAVVENVIESKYKTLSFELRGEGTLPRLTVERPISRSKTGGPALKFKKMLLGLSQSLPIVVRNDGIIPTKFALEWISRDSDEFGCTEIHLTPVLKPTESRALEVRFSPASSRKIEAELKIKVVDNAFEDLVVQISGEGYVDDLTIDNLPQDSDNEIAFGDCQIGEVKQVRFQIKNHSQSTMQISFSEHSEFLFSPPSCHLSAKTSRDVTVYFMATQPVDVQKINATLKCTKIRLLDPRESGWEDSIRSVKWLNAEGQSEQNLEPSYDVLSTTTDYPLILSTFADYSSFECDISDFSFKSTLMYQTRVYNFKVQNTSRVNLKVSLALFNVEGVLIEPPETSPFSVVPSKESIEPGDSASFQVKFMPEDVGDFFCTLAILAGNLSKESKSLQVEIRGRSERPLCHFELEHSDYISRERRIPETFLSEGIPVVLDPRTRVMEFASCGVKTKTTKRFYILNPTNLAYEFAWISKGINERIFKCLTPKGMVASNKKFEMIFEYYPESVDIKESLWTFRILDQKVDVPFLLVGQATEPDVFVDKTAVNFKSILVDRKSKEIVKLLNNESIPFQFAFSDASFEINGAGLPVLSFSPSSGVIPPNSETPVEITFSPSAEKLFNFNLICNVKKKPSPLSINVKGEGYEVHDSLEIELLDGSRVPLVSGQSQENVLDFGQIQVNDKRMKRITLFNSGKYNFDFNWKLPPKFPNHVSISPDSGTVIRGEKRTFDVTFHPTSLTLIKNLKAVCQVVNGRTYNLNIFGESTKPAVKFSTNQLNFGPQFIVKANAAPITTSVTIKNEDSKEMSIEVINPKSDFLELALAQTTLEAGESTLFSVTFYPRELKKYQETIGFEINGLSTVELDVTGEGTEFKVEATSQDRAVNFGAVRVGTTVSRSAKIVNKSIITASFIIGPSANIEHLALNGISVSHHGEYTLKPKSSLNLEFKFSPLSRTPAFHEELYLETNGILRHLLSVSGACQGIDIRLESDTLPFGAVVQKSSTARKIQLQNAGDIGAKFAWNPALFYPDFSISPSEGYISPGTDIPLEITFNPTEVNPDIRYDALPCSIEGIADLHITLTGTCIPQPSQVDAIKFSTPVRGSETKSISLMNKTNYPWKITPIIENPYFKGGDLFELEPGQTKSYEVTFSPLETVGLGDGGRHEGSLFFPLADGTGLLYKLYGYADKPSPVATITREIASKSQHTEILSVYNWLKRPQRFRVSMDLVKPDYVTMKGADFIDVPPLMSKDYKLSFFSHREGSVAAKIVFRNEQSQEFTFWNINFKSTPPGVLSTLEMNTSVRQVCSREVMIHNPLSTTAVFNSACPSAEVAVPHTFSIAPKTDFVAPIEFLPLLPREAVTRLTFTSPDLGVFIYDLKLLASPAPPERSIHFKVGLGGCQTQVFRFLSHCKSKTEYACKIENPDFSVEKTVSVPAAGPGGTEVTVEITYEPSHLGDARTQLSVSSSLGGEYICPLFGHCIAPRPQGPITIRPGAPACVPFKNVFSSSTTFNFAVDNPAFSVKASEVIPSKKAIQILVSFKPPGTADGAKGEKALAAHAAAANTFMSNGSTKVGKLTVTSLASSQVVWVYYLKLSS